MKQAQSPKPAPPPEPQDEESRSGGGSLFDQLGSMPLGGGHAPQNKPHLAPQTAGQDLGSSNVPQGGGDPLSQLLGGLMGGGQGAATGQGGSDPLSSLLGSLGGGASNAGAGGLGDLLSGLMGGGQGAAPGQGGSDPLSGLLGNLMGSGQGAASQGGDPLSGLLGGLMGGGTESPSMGGGPGGAAQFLLGKLTAGGSGSSNVGDLLQMLGGGQRVERAHLHASGLTQEYAQHSGLDHESASAELEKVVSLLQHRMSGGQGG